MTIAVVLGVVAILAINGAAIFLGLRHWPLSRRIALSTVVPILIGVALSVFGSYLAPPPAPEQAWEAYRGKLVRQAPAFAVLFAGDAALEAQLKADVLRISSDTTLRQRQREEQLTAAGENLFRAVHKKAAKGDGRLLLDYMAAHLELQSAVQRRAPELCGQMALNRSVSAELTATERPILDRKIAILMQAYRTSDPAVPLGTSREVMALLRRVVKDWTPQQIKDLGNYNKLTLAQACTYDIAIAKSAQALPEADRIALVRMVFADVK